MPVFKQHVYYLRHLISEQGTQPLSQKVIAITNLKKPNNVYELLIFIVESATIGDSFHYYLT